MKIQDVPRQYQAYFAIGQVEGVIACADALTKEEMIEEIKSIIKELEKESENGKATLQN